jgi:hypothetical protein
MRVKKGFRELKKVKMIYIFAKPSQKTVEIIEKIGKTNLP